MRRGASSLTVVCAALASAALLSAAPTAASAAPRAAAMSSQTRYYLQLAERGVSQTPAWWNRSLQWYDETLDARGTQPLATLWSTVPLFETLDEIAIAKPTTQHLAAVAQFATGEQRYWNPDLTPQPAFAPSLYSASATNPHYWFDDNGWLALAYLDAYQATGTAEDLFYAENAFNFIVAEGWNPVAGGIWQNTGETQEAGESLGSATDLAARLYQATDDPTYLNWAQTLLAWANANLMTPDGLYNGDTPLQPQMPHDGQGAMLAALVSLCQSTGVKSWCQQAESLAGAELEFLPPLNQGPQYDNILLRGILTLYAYDHQARWYRFVVAQARRIQQNSRDASGFYLFNWVGTSDIDYGSPGLLRTEAANISVFADLATVEPPK